MSEFLTAILQFPTVIFTILLGVVAAYWVFVLLGALDLDILDDVGEVDSDLDGEPDGVAGVLQTLGLGGVPITLVISLLVLGSWVFCIVTMRFLGDGTAGWIAAGAAVGAFALSVPVTAAAVRPMRRLFVTHPAIENRSLVGRICTVTTGRVDEGFGQAEIDDGGAGLLVQVRYLGPGRLARGDKALVFDYKDEVFHVAPVGEVLDRHLRDLQ